VCCIVRRRRQHWRYCRRCARFKYYLGSIVVEEDTLGTGALAFACEFFRDTCGPGFSPEGAFSALFQKCFMRLKR